MFWRVSGLRWRCRNLSVPEVAVTCWLAFSLGACGAGDGLRSSLRIDAAGDGSLRFERSAARAAGGRARIEMRNPSTIPHAIGVRGEGVEEIGETVGKGGTSSVEADLEPGAYELFCPVGSHEQAGMTARLVVR
jgi:plastocyanin